MWAHTNAMTMTGILSRQTGMLTRAAALLLGLFAFQLLGLPQMVTGPVVNAGLLTAALMVGPVYGAAVGALTPALALVRGILPLPLAPMVPFIAAGNASFILMFSALRPRFGFWAVLPAAVTKFLVLSAAVELFVTVPPPVAAMMQTPQLVTALLGGCLVAAAHPLLKGRDPSRTA